MKTTEQPTEVKTVDLIKVQTIKKKHVEQILLPFERGPNSISPDSLDFLAYIDAFDAILARRRDNGHLVVLRVVTYVNYKLDLLREGHPGNLVPRETYETVREQCRVTVSSLPQLLLD